RETPRSSEASGREAVEVEGARRICSALVAAPRSPVAAVRGRPRTRRSLGQAEREQARAWRRGRPLSSLPLLLFAPGPVPQVERSRAGPAVSLESRRVR